jgi:hypothetical protein
MNHRPARPDLIGDLSHQQAPRAVCGACSQARDADACVHHP